MARMNDEVADLLYEYADLISISRGDPHKARAYEKAARSVGGYHGDIATLDHKGLCKIPNVGSSIAEKIGEYREAGIIQAIEDLRAQIPDGVRSLVASEKPIPVMEAFTSMPYVDRVLAKGETKSSVMTTKGLQVDVRVVEPAVWGAALQYFTGSKAHNVRIREMAVRRKLKLSEYGLFRAQTGRLIVAETEEEVYEHLGLPWIPPTLREDRGEVEAALEGRLPTVVQARDIRGDLHTHTDLTDGVAPLEEMIEAARG